MFGLVRYWFFFILATTSTLTTTIQVQAIVILVHGSFANEEDWWRPGGQFHDTLAQRVSAKKQRLLPFRWQSGWHGGFVGKSIEVAGTRLAKVMKPFLFKEPIVLIGHSNGVNVVFEACKYLQRNAINITYPGQPVIYPITTVYALAPVVITSDISDVMRVVCHVVNCFSLGDKTLDKLEPLGIYKRLYDDHERVYNYSVKMTTKDGDHVLFGHTDIHDALVARWLLEIDPVSISKQEPGVALNTASVLLTKEQPPIQVQLMDAEIRTIKMMRFLAQTTAILGKTALVLYLANKLCSVIW